MNKDFEHTITVEGTPVELIQQIRKMLAFIEQNTPKFEENVLLAGRYLAHANYQLQCVNTIIEQDKLGNVVEDISVPKITDYSENSGRMN